MSEADQPVFDGRRSATPYFTGGEWNGTPTWIAQADQRPLRRADPPLYLGTLTKTLTFNSGALFVQTHIGSPYYKNMTCGPYASAAWTTTLTYSDSPTRAALLTHAEPSVGNPPAKTNMGYYWKELASNGGVGQFFTDGDGSPWNGLFNVYFYLFRDPNKDWVLAVCMNFSSIAIPGYPLGLHYQANIYLKNGGGGPNGTYSLSGSGNEDYPAGKNGSNAIEVFDYAWAGTTPPFPNVWPEPIHLLSGSTDASITIS
jgi:hypothetical protein